MSHNVPDGHLHVLKFFKIYFLKVNSMLFTMVKTIFAELHVFEYGGTTFGTFEKTCFKC